MMISIASGYINNIFDEFSLRIDHIQSEPSPDQARGGGGVSISLFAFSFFTFKHFDDS